MTRVRPQHPARVDALVVTWKGRDRLGACLDSLAAQNTTADLSTLVIDNASTDGTAQLLEHRHDVRVHRSEVNRGFAGGVALGASLSTAEYLLLLNDDAILAPTALQEMLEVMEQPDGHNVAAATATVLLSGTYRLTNTPNPTALTDGSTWAVPDDNGEVLVNSTGNVVDRFGRGSDRDWLAMVGHVNSSNDVFGFCGAAVLLRTTALGEVGGFDPGLFLYYEDTDLSWRLRSSGWTIQWVPTAIAHHEHSASSGVSSPTFRFYNTRNSLRVAARYLSVPAAGAAWALAFGGALRAAARRASDSAPRWQALAGAAVALPGDLKTRRQWRKRARTVAAKYAR